MISYPAAIAALNSLDKRINDTAATLDGGAGDAAKETRIASLELEKRDLQTIVNNYEQTIANTQNADGSIAERRLASLPGKDLSRFIEEIKSQASSGAKVILFNPSSQVYDATLRLIEEKTSVSFIDLTFGILASAHYDIRFLSGALLALDQTDRRKAVDLITGKESMVQITGDYDEESSVEILQVFGLTDLDGTLFLTSIN